MATDRKTSTQIRRSQVERRTEARERIVGSALEQIAECGSRNVSLARIGEAAGYSRGIVHHHFGSRLNLLRAVLSSAQGFETPDRAIAPEARLQDLISIYLGGVRERGAGSRAFLVLWAESVADPELAQLFEDRDAGFLTYLADCLSDGQSDGSFAEVIDPDVSALVIVGLLRGTALQLMTTAVRAGPADAVDAASRLVLRGLTTR